MIIIVIIAIGCQYLWRILVIELTKDSSIGTLTYSLNYCFPIYRIPDFLVGCCLSAISNLRGTKMSYLQASIGEIIIVALTITYGYMMFSGKILISANCNNTYALIIVAMTIYIMGFEMGIVSKLLSCNIMVCLGDLSKYTYLIHFVVVEWIGAFEIVGIFKLNIPIKIILNVVFTYTLTFAYVKLRKKFAI
jgi:peptidoglycan/LPS O-acetylase OafA/YrhL